MQRIKTQKLDIKASPEFALQMLNFLGVKAFPNRYFLLIENHVYIEAQSFRIYNEKDKPTDVIVHFDGYSCKFKVHGGDIYFM